MVTVQGYLPDDDGRAVHAVAEGLREVDEVAWRRLVPGAPPPLH